MSESCKECRFFKAHKTEYGSFDNFGVPVHRTVERNVCRRRHVFVPHEPTDWCGEFKCDPDFEVAGHETITVESIPGNVIEAAALVKEYLRCGRPSLSSLCGVRLA